MGFGGNFYRVTPLEHRNFSANYSVTELNELLGESVFVGASEEVVHKQTRYSFDDLLPTKQFL